MQIRDMGPERYDSGGDGANFRAIMRTICWGLMGLAMVVMFGLVMVLLY